MTLPAGWRLLTPHELAGEDKTRLIIGPFGSNLKTSDYRPDGVPLVFVRDIRQAIFRTPRQFVDSAKAEELSSHVAHPGDVLITKMGEPPGDAAVYTGTQPAVITADCIRLRPIDDFDPRFVAFAMQAPAVKRQVELITSGIAQRKVSLARFRSGLSIPMPPLEEQLRIVDLLEGLLSRLDAANAYLKSSRRRLLAMERSVLGELHRGPTKPLGEVAVGSGYGTSAKCVAGGPGVAVVRIPNLVHGHIDLGDEKRVADPAADVTGAMLAPGDLLIVRTNGSVDLIGRSAVVQDSIDAAYASYLIRYRLDLGLVRPEWVQAMLSAPQVRRKIEPLAASSAGQHNLSLAKLDPLELPIPSLSSQDDGLARLAELRRSKERTRAGFEFAGQRAVALRRAVLAAAFSGRLTDTAPGLSEVSEMIDA